MGKTGWEFLKRHMSLVLIAAVGSLAVISTLVAMSIKPASRTPASIPSKPTTLQPSPAFNGHEFKKSGGNLDVIIRKGDGSTSFAGGQSGELIGSISALTDLKGLEYSWILPAGVQATSGDIEGTLGDLNVGERRMLNLTVSSSSGENEQVYLHVYRMVNGEAVGQMAQYNTVHQPRIDQELKSKLDVLNQKAERGESFKLMQ